MNLIVIRNISLTIASGVLLAISANFPVWWWLSLVGLVPFLVVAYQVTARIAFWWGWLFGAVYMTGVWWFLFDTLPLDWAGIESQMAGYILVSYSLILVAIIPSVLSGVWSYLFARYRQGNLWDIGLGTGWWVFLELARAWLVSVFLYGPGGSVGINWTSGFLGYNLAPSSLLLPLASLGGVYLLSAVAVTCNLFILVAWRLRTSGQFGQKKFKLGGLGLAALGVIGLALVYQQVFLTAETDRSVRFGVANTYAPSYSRVTKDELRLQLADKKDFVSGQLSEMEIMPEVMVFPEDNRLLWYLATEGERDFIENLGDQSGPTLWIDSERAPNQSGSPNLRFTYLDDSNGDYEYSGKEFLIPHGEYVPYVSKFFLTMIGKREWVVGFENIRRNSRGEYSRGYDYQGLYVEATACSDLMLANLYSGAVDRGAGFLINSASHSLFNGSQILYHQTVNVAKVRAVETNRYFIYSANFMPSFVLDNRGRVVVSSVYGVHQGDILYTEVPVIKQETVYQRWYFLAPYLLILTVGIIFLKSSKPDL